MAIVISEGPKLTRREELEFEVAEMIEEAPTSDEPVNPLTLASIILDLIEVDWPVI